METVTISSDFAVVIPPAVREALNLQAGAQLNVIPYAGRIEFVPVEDIRNLRGALRGIDTTIERDPDRL